MANKSLAMNIPLRRIMMTTVTGVIALLLALVALLALPVYGAFMVIWMHIPLASVLSTVGPLVMLFGVGAWLTFRAARRA
jgi:hypothetical protein